MPYKSQEYSKYVGNKRQAKRRGILFLLTFEEWLKIWTDSGHFHERGTFRHQYHLARKRRYRQ